MNISRCLKDNTVHEHNCRQHSVWQYGGLTNIFSAFSSLIGSVPADE